LITRAAISTSSRALILSRGEIWCAIPKKASELGFDTGPAPSEAAALTAADATANRQALGTNRGL
jgi:hypothetical protein